MSDSSFSDSSDLDDIAEYEMIMEINNEDQDEVEAVRMRRYINRERDVAEERLMADYFGPHPKYPAEYFRRRYRMNRELFLEIVQERFYPQCHRLFKSFTVARDEKNAMFKRRQESARKNVERAFGVLQGRWRIIAQPVRGWTVNKLRRIMYTCIILHNMILKNQRYAISEVGEIYICPQQNILRTWVERCAIRKRKAKELRDKQTHSRLQRSLIEHVWALHQP
ncbi:ALP1-like protein isoform X1 [Tanacetum coccineum]